MDKNIKLKLVCIILNRGKSDEVFSYLSNFYGNHFTTLLGRGTAKQTWRSLFGIGDIEKDVLLFPTLAKNIPTMFEDLKGTFKIGNGDGIAFTVKINSVVGTQLLEEFANLEA